MAARRPKKKILSQKRKEYWGPRNKWTMKRNSRRSGLVSIWRRKALSCRYFLRVKNGDTRPKTKFQTPRNDGGCPFHPALGISIRQPAHLRGLPTENTHFEIFLGGIVLWIPDEIHPTNAGSAEFVSKVNGWWKSQRLRSENKHQSWQNKRKEREEGEYFWLVVEGGNGEDEQHLKEKKHVCFFLQAKMIR